MTPIRSSTARVVAAAWLAAVCAAVPARAQHGWSHAATLCPSGCQYDYYQDALAVDDDGNVTAVWGAEVIRAARFEPAASTWTTPTNLSSPGTRQPHVAVDRDGVVTAVWADVRVQAARYTPGTRTWGPALDISAEDGLGYVEHPRVAADAAGNVIAVFGRYTFMPDLFSVQAVRYDATSGAWGTPIDLARQFALVGYSRPRPQVAVDDAGNATVVWTGSNGTVNVIQAARYSIGGGTWGGTVTVSSTTSSWEGPRVAVDAAGDVTVVWTAVTTGPPGLIQAARYSAGSATWSAVTDLSPSGWFPELAVHAGGTAIAVWVQPDLAGVYRIIAARYSPAGGAWGAAVPLSTGVRLTTGVNVAFPVVAFDPAGDATAVWAQSDGATHWLESARYVGDSESWSPAGRLPGLPVETDQYPSGLVADAAGDVTALWTRAPFVGPSAIFTGRWVAAPAPPAIEWITPDTGALAVHFTGPVTSFTRFTATSIEYSLDDGATWAARSPASLSSPLLIGGLLSGVPYTVRLRALNAAGTGTASLPAVATPGPTPGPPRDLFTASIVGNLVTIAWTPPPNSIAPTGYILEGGINRGEVLASIPTGSMAPTFRFVAPTGTFYIRVLAVAGALRSAPSNEVRLVVNVPAPPSAPRHLLGLSNGSTVTLSWVNTLEGGTPTSLWLNVSGALSGTLPLPLAQNFTFAGVPSGTYTLSLSARNAVGTSPPSNAVTLTFPSPCSGVPGVPTRFITTRIGYAISVEWGPPETGAAVTGYVLSVTGSYAGAFPTTGRALSGTVGPGSYTLSVAAANPCGTGPATPSQTVAIP